VLRRISPTQRWLRPTGRNRHDLRAVLLQTLEDGRLHAELALHSSELMPGGSPTFPTAAHIERLYDDLEALFVLVAERFAPRTLGGFRQHFLARFPSGEHGPA
jgi:hypothetical protein